MFDILVPLVERWRIDPPQAQPARRACACRSRKKAEGEASPFRHDRHHVHQNVVISMVFLPPLSLSTQSRKRIPAGQVMTGSSSVAWNSGAHLGQMAYEPTRTLPGSNGEILGAKGSLVQAAAGAV